MGARGADTARNTGKPDLLSHSDEHPRYNGGVGFCVEGGNQPGPMNVLNYIKTRVYAPVVMAAIIWGPTRAAGATDLPGSTRNFFAEHCFTCHDTDTKKGGLDLGELSWKPTDVRNFDQWVKVFDKVDQEKMPPPSKKRPDPALRATFLKSLRTDLRAANRAKQERDGRVVLRRLNRVEYENTLHDLLAIDVPLAALSPRRRHNKWLRQRRRRLAAVDASDGALPRSRRCGHLRRRWHSVGGPKSFINVYVIRTKRASGTTPRRRKRRLSACCRTRS